MEQVDPLAQWDRWERKVPQGQEDLQVQVDHLAQEVHQVQEVHQEHLDQQD